MSSAVTDRRAHPRRPLTLPVTMARVGGRTLEDSGTTVDLSEGGAQVSGVTAFGLGDVVVMTLASGDRSITHQALVVGVSDGDKLHVAFRSMDQDALRDLRRLLNDGR